MYFHNEILRALVYARLLLATGFHLVSRQCFQLAFNFWVFFLDCPISEFLSYNHLFPKMYTVVEICVHTKPPVWSKTTLITGNVEGARVDPSTCKMKTFFLMSLAVCQFSKKKFCL